jgi:hypothetical protein
MTHHPALKTVLARKRTGLALAALLALVPAAAQTPATQKVTGPQARYWVSAETGSGLNASAMQGGAGGLGSMMGALMGRGGPTKTLRLELGGLRDGQPSEAVHAVPASLGVGPSLVLLGPERAQAQPDRPERDVPEMPPDKPRGRMLFFWGCGESAGAGQPVVLDFARMADGVLPANLRSVALPAGRSGPGFGRDRGYADWPNRRHSASVPAQGSLVGEHQVQGNFIPEIRFAVGATHDYMEPLTLSRNPMPSGAQLLKWNRPATALGFFASGMGFKEGSDGAADMVMWNSSAARLLGGEQLNGFLAPADTERLIKSSVVMNASTTECAVPKEALAAAGGDLMMVNLNAFGPELNVVHPPRPQDPRQTWDQQYQVKLRLRSFTGSFAGMGAGMAGGAEGEGARKGAEAKEEKPASPADAVKGLLKGILGR